MTIFYYFEYFSFKNLWSTLKTIKCKIASYGFCTQIETRLVITSFTMTQSLFNNVAERDGAPMNGQLKDLQHETIINLHGPQFIVVCTNLNNSHRNYVIYMKFLAASYTNLCDWHYFKSAWEEHTQVVKACWTALAILVKHGTQCFE